MERQGCVVKALENPNLNGILLGLTLREHRLKLREDFFSCCHGQGYYEAIGPRRPLSIIGQSIRCPLHQRIRHTEEVLRLYYKLWNSDAPAPHQLNPNHSAKLLRHVAETLKGYRPQGTIIHGRKGQLSEIWPMALACSWRFGIQTHIVRPQKKQQNILPDPTKVGGNLAIFIEQADKLWDHQYTEVIDSLVNFAYNSNAFLWIELCLEESKKEEKSSAKNHSVSKMIQKRIEQARSKSPFEFLSKDCLSRLQSLCALPRITFDEEVEL